MRVHPGILGVVLLLAACASPPSEEAQDDAEGAAVEGAVPGIPVRNFFEVNPKKLYRGARPDEAGIRYLKEQVGIRTIVSLELPDFIEATPMAVAEEKALAERAGIVFQHKPITSFDPAVERSFDARIDEILAIFRDPKAQPVYVHCRHGRDRTGLTVALERVLQEGWKPERAYNEMVERGYRTLFINLTHYYELKTGWDKP
jgi:protein tyrosine/serine phosphatase